VQGFEVYGTRREVELSFHMSNFTPCTLKPKPYTTSNLIWL